MLSASAAFAQTVYGRPVPMMRPHEAPHYWNDHGYHGYHGEHHPQCPRMSHGYGMHGRFDDRDERNERFDPDMPKEIRAIAVEVAKLKIDLDEALHANPMEREKAFELHDKIMKLEQDIERWKFVKKVDRIEAFRKNREEFRQNRKNKAKPSAAETNTEAK